MQLKDLVRQVLTEIAQGLNEAQGMPADSQEIVIPKYVADTGKGSTFDQTTRRTVNLVTFHVSLTVANESESGTVSNTGGQGGLRVAGITAGVSGSNAASASSANKEENIQTVRFNVPVLWPSHDGSEKPQGRQRKSVSEMQQDLRQHKESAV